MLPNFLIIGADGAGTTSLYHYLKSHPDIYMPAVKELHYFSERTASKTRRALPQDRGEYEAFFREAGPALARGEASPSYLRCQEAVKRIRQTIPDARLIVSLRQPADRAYSIYNLRLRGGLEDRPVGEALTKDDLYIQRRFYYPGLRRYFDAFSPSQIHVVLFDDLVTDAAGVCVNLFAFLGVGDRHRPDVGQRHGRRDRVQRFPKLARLYRRNASLKKVWRLLPPRARSLAESLYVKRRPALPPELRAYVTEQYRTDILKTSELIGRDLTPWLSEAPA